jgi:hypothetical protein
VLEIRSEELALSSRVESAPDFRPGQQLAEIALTFEGESIYVFPLFTASSVRQGFQIERLKVVEYVFILRPGKLASFQSIDGVCHVYYSYFLLEDLSVSPM